MKTYKMKFSDDRIVTFLYDSSDYGTNIITNGNWKIHEYFSKMRTSLSISKVFTNETEYVAFFASDSPRKDYCVYTKDSLFFEKLEAGKGFIFFSPNYDKDRLYYMELLELNEILYLKRNHIIEPVQMPDSFFNSYFKLEDGRFLKLLGQGNAGQLFNDLANLNAMEEFMLANSYEQ